MRENDVLRNQSNFTSKYDTLRSKISNYSDPYVRIDLTLLNENVAIDSFFTKTKKKV